MKILLVHNCYGSSAPSGENRVFAAEKTLLEKHGHEVATYTRHSDEIRTGGAIRRIWGKIKGALCTVGNPFAAHEVAKVCRAFKPDIVHFHNTFPLISPLAIRAAHRSGAKVVMTLHNYRTVCAAGVPTRNGKVCTECFRRSAHSAQGKKGNLSVWPAIRHRCYRGSLFATLPLALNIRLYRKSWAKWVDQFVCLTPFAKEMMCAGGLFADKLVVKGNFIAAIAISNVSRRSGVVYVGRLSEEKGIRTVIEAWNLMKCAAPDLTIIGDGDYRSDYVALAKNPKIRFVGQKPHDEVLKAMSEAAFVVIPSLCYEGLPTNLMESFMLGTPCLVSDLGALPSLVGKGGAVFEAGNPQSLADAVRAVFSRQDYDAMCTAARHEAEARYSEDANYGRLMEIYEAVRK